MRSIDQRSEDVSVLAIRKTGDIIIGRGASRAAIDRESLSIGEDQCQLVADDNLDCTAAIAAAVRHPALCRFRCPRDVIGQHIAFFTWEVDVAIKAEAFASDTFTGIGFWAARVWSYQGAPLPPPGTGHEDAGCLTAKSRLDFPDPRQRQTLPCLLTRFALALPVPTTGAAALPSLWFRPYALFTTQNETRYLNWDRANADYFVRWNTDWDHVPISAGVTMRNT